MLSVDTSNALVHGVNYKTRAFDAQKVSKNCFLVGTQALNQKNEVHLVEVNEELDNFSRIQIYAHPHEIWSLSCCPTDSKKFFTVYNTVPDFKCSLWRTSPKNKLREIGQLSRPESKQIKRVLWQPSDLDKVCTIDVESVHLWDAQTLEHIQGTAGNALGQFEAGCWTSRLGDQVLVTNRTEIQLFDFKSNKTSVCIEHAHEIFTRDIDVNLDNSHYLMSGGDDGRVKYWDLRNVKEPVMTYENHEHWVTQVRFNPFRPFLALSADSCGIVALHDFGSQSEQSGHDCDMVGKLRNCRVKQYNDHGTTVTAICWGSVDMNPLVFASLSYDGRLVINQAKFA
ncbi:EARP-interacting protein homolog [Schistocerca gregaria]|uniref:EARP-interacting protein homolog n=1 Tax=Schistocerca gregaria TaxID=7010 RepID=UPI00211ECA6C|nr:EARP-interacting protein homolog [Schistocerca gregaria]